MEATAPLRPTGVFFCLGRVLWCGGCIGEAEDEEHAV